jgi:hypothetical protein
LVWSAHPCWRIGLETFRFGPQDHVGDVGEEYRKEEKALLSSRTATR